MIMDESEVFKTNHSEKALNVDENIAKTNASKRKGPILENRLSQFESRNLEDFSRGSAIIGQLNDDFSKIPEIIKKNGDFLEGTIEADELKKYQAIEEFKKRKEARKFVDRLAVIASETKRINLDLDIS